MSFVALFHCWSGRKAVLTKFGDSGLLCQRHIEPKGSGAPGQIKNESCCKLDDLT